MENYSEKIRIIARNIVKTRKNKHLTQQELAGKIGWTRAQILKYEKGEVKRMSYLFLLDVAKALDVTIEDLENENLGNEELKDKEMEDRNVEE